MTKSQISHQSSSRHRLLSIGCAALLGLAIGAQGALANETTWAASGGFQSFRPGEAAAPIMLAQSQEPGRRSEQPQASGPMDMSDEGYNARYIFGMTKGIANSTLHSGWKPLFFLFTVPLDIVTLPFSAIGGFF